MSDSSQGPGWWLASDGKWYPPEQAPTATPPAQPPPPAPNAGIPIAGTATRPGPVGPPPTSSGAGKGCLIALAVVGGLVALSVIGIIVAIAFFGQKAVDTVNEAIEDKPCTIVTSSQASDVLDGQYDAVQLKGINSLGGVILDNRVIGDANGCWIRPATGSNGERNGRVAQTGGGSARYDQELAQAKGTSTDQGNGLTLETEGYFLKDVDGVGDEAFCTAPDLSGMFASGLLVRNGDTLTYIAFDVAGTSAFQDTTGANFLSGGEENCELATQLAKEAGL